MVTGVRRVVDAVLVLLSSMFSVASVGRFARRWRRLFATLSVTAVVASMAAVFAPVAVPAAGATTAPPANFFTVVDTGGPNDVNAEQVDLTQMGRDDKTDPSVYDLFWSWDTTNFTAQTGNACALFDSNNNGNIDFAVCAEVENVPSGTTTNVEQTAVSPLAVTCNDSKNDRCAQPSNPLPLGSGNVVVGDLFNFNPSPPANLVTDTDPFPNLNPDQTWPNDTSIQIKVKKAFLPANAVLANVCTYPSLGNTGNNNPFDCIVNAGGGFLKIVKVAPGGTTQTFTFTTNPGSITKTINGAGSTQAYSVPIGTNYSIAETAVTGWHLDSASCKLETGTSTGTYPTQGSANTVSAITVQSGKVTTCTFTNSATPALAVVKDNDGNRDGTFNDSETVPADVAYPYTVTYRGQVTNNSLSDATITAITDDKKAAPLSLTANTTAPNNAVSCASLINTTIAGGATETCYFDVVFNGPSATPVTNTLSFTASSGAGSDTKSDTSTVTFTARTFALGLTKTDDLNPKHYDHVGQVVTFTLTATNTGNVTLHNVAVTDSPALDGFSCSPSVPVASLAPGAHVTCTGTHTITQTDLDARFYTDTASATSTETDAPDAMDTIFANRSPALGLAKSADPTTYNHVGQVITYTYTITNTGNVTLPGPFSITDDHIGSPVGAPFTCGSGPLAPGQSTSCTNTYSITQADLNTGQVTNTAMASTVYNEKEVDSPTAQATVTAVQSPALLLDKSAAESTYSHVGDVIHYSYEVTNSGNVTLTDPITVTDDKTTATCPDLPAGGLVPGASITCTATTTITQADIDSGSVTNVAYAKSGEVKSNTDTVTVPATQSPAFTLVKDANPAPGTIVQPGQSITYAITYTNTGNVTLADAVITDTLPVGAVFGSVADGGSYDVSTKVASWHTGAVAPGAVKTVHWTVTVASGLPAGSEIVNVATVGDKPSNEVKHPVASGALTLVKKVDKTSAAYGDVVTYTLAATATGTLDQTGVVVSDTIPTGTTYVAGSAAPSAIASYNSATRTVSWAVGDVAAGATVGGLTFKVKIDSPKPAADGSIPGKTISNVGSVQSTQTPKTPSNVVKTVVIAVLGVKVVKPPVQVLPFTGVPIPVQPVALVALVMIGAGILMTSTRRRRQH